MISIYLATFSIVDIVNFYSSINTLIQCYFSLMLASTKALGRQVHNYIARNFKLLQVHGTNQRQYDKLTTAHNFNRLNKDIITLFPIIIPIITLLLLLPYIHIRLLHCTQLLMIIFEFHPENPYFKCIFFYVNLQRVFLFLKSIIITLGSFFLENIIIYFNFYNCVT